MSSSMATSDLSQPTAYAGLTGKLSQLSGQISGGALLAIGLVITADVILRRAIGTPIKGLFELTELALAAVMALAFADANYRRIHVTMELVGSMTGRKLGLHFLAALLTACVFILYTAFLFIFGSEKGQFGENTLVLQLPLQPFWYLTATLIGISAIVQFVVCLEEAVALFSLRSREFLREIAAPLFGLALAILLGLVLIHWQAQMGPVTKVVVGFACLYALALSHVPIGVSMALAGLAGIYALLGVAPATQVGVNNVVSTISSSDIASVPLFLLMGNLAVAAGFAELIFAAATTFFGRFRGGYAIATIIGSAGFGAISGSSVATTATIGKVAYQEMRSRSYAPQFATGTIAAGGTLGALIPPSVILIIYCVIAEQSISESFMAALVPGLLATALYVVAIIIQVRVKPELAEISGATDEPAGAVSPLRAVVSAWRPVLLFLLVVGGLYGGLFTTQEAAAVGAGFAFMFWLISGRASWEGLVQVGRDAVATSATLYLLIIGASVFGAFLNLAGITQAILAFIDPATTPGWLAITALVIMYLLLGSVFDTVAALVVTAPFVIPIVSAFHYDLIWWGIITLSLIEIGMIHPPVGMNVFVIKSVVKDVDLTTIFKGVIPFLIADGIRLILLIVFPIITLWLPNLLR
jgi:tripartite ATP-independent transporter DctM subunit